MGILRLVVPRWDRFGGLVHGFLGRRSSSRQPPSASSNLSGDTGDDPGILEQQWSELKLIAGRHDFAVTTARQVHGDTILKVSNGAAGVAGVGDGLLTDAPNLYVGVTAADCVPLLLLEPGRRVAAAVHAGWRGTAAGIAVRAVARMTEEYGVEPSAVHAALGPSIGPCCYEVGQEVAEQIGANWAEELKRAWRPHGVKGYLDLRGVNEAQLVAAAVPPGQIHRVGPCTACEVELFFSYRKEGKTGSQLSFIGWRS